LRAKLISSEKYNDFIEEGRKYIESNNLYPELKAALKTSKDDEKDIDLITDAFLAGLWHSKDPKITRMHADAVIGTNNQFYNNQPVNTADAAIGAVVDIANLEPVKYLAHSTKLVGRATRMGVKKIPFGNGTVGMAYNGFKEGLHNRTVDVINNRIT